MRIELPLCRLVIFSFWLQLFAPLAAAQKPVNQPQTPAGGLQFRVSAAARRPEKPQKRAPAEIENLSAAETREIFDRLPPLSVEAPEDDAAFKIRPETRKPPKTGNVVPVKFPSEEKKKAPPVRAETLQGLEIERYSPAGKTPLAADLSVTFSQPMVAVTGQSEASASVPVRLTPAVEGNWRWLGTDTLVFEAKERFPMATVFTVTVPKGTKAAGGASLAKDFSWTFATPPPTVEKFVPQNGSGDIFPEYAIMAAKFNQEIDEREIFSKISVTAGGRPMPVKLISAEVDSSYEAYQRLGEVKPKHWLAFRTVERLPLDAEVKVVFEKGLASAEGPATSEREQIFSFNTLGPFRLSAFYCGYSQPNPRQCQPSDDFRLQFNRSLFPGKIDPSLIKIEPPIENARIEKDGSGTSIYIKGTKKTNTTYRVTLSGEAIDFYKLKIGRDISAEFNVGLEIPRFFAQGGNFLTLDPHARPVFSVYTRNHPTFKVRLYAVTPEDYPSYSELLDEDRNNGRLVPTPKFGRLIFDKTVETNAELNVFTETRIDLSAALPNKFGHVVLIAEPLLANEDNLYQYYNQPFIAWIQSTNIGVDAFADYEKMIAFVTDLQTGKPLENAAVSIISYKTPLSDALTDRNGIAELAKPEFDGHVRLIVKNDADSAILGGYVDWRTYWKSGRLRWFVFDDRKMYRPGEEVSVKGYLRKVTGGKFTDIAAFDNRTRNVSYILKDSRAVEVAQGTAAINEFGAFDFKIKLPENANLGPQRLEFWSAGVSGSPEFEHVFQAQEFRRPEFEVTVATETPAPYLVGTSAVVSAEAKYFTGGAFADAQMQWSLFTWEAKYSPPNHESFNFGRFIPWWLHYSDELPRNANYYPAQTTVGTTDENGEHRLNLDFLSANPARPYNLRMVAETTDVNRQSVADAKNFLVHPAEVYVGLRTPKTFVRQGATLTVETVATDLDGKRVSGAPIEIKAVLKDWKYGASWQEIVIDTQTCRLTSAEKPVSCNFPVKQGGRFAITATVLDARERPNTSDLTVWAAGGKTPPKRGLPQEQVDLIPDKKDYAPGEAAEILVNAPFFPAEGVMTLERNGMVKTERLTLNEASTVLQIPIEERFLPNIRVKVDLVGAAGRTNDGGEVDKNLPPRPAFASGEINLTVSTASRRLDVAVEPLAKTTEPGQETEINVEVKDSLGNPVRDSEVALVAVDEGVLSLADYKISNPLDAFYQPIGSGVAHYRSREKVILGNPADKLSAAAIESLPVENRAFSALLVDGMENSDFKGRSVRREVKEVYKNWDRGDVAYIITGEEKALFEKSQINIRRNFDALAFYSPSVKTDSSGKATVPVKLPDNLTRYRITAVAVTKSRQFGLGESSVTARQDLMVRPSALRFMNFGDKAELPVVVQNQSDKPLTVNVAMRGAGARLLEGSGRKVTLAAGARAELRFAVAVEAAGTARFQVGAVSGQSADAAEFAFPVYTPATTETFATYGTTDENGAIVRSVRPPGDVFPQFGGLEVTTSSTQLQELTDAFIYVYNYSFGCTEQVSSRILSIAALRDVLQAFKAKEMPSKERIEAQMRFDFERLRTLQHSDGGFSFWRADDASVPYVSAHVAHALARAKMKGYPVPPEVVGKSLGYLKNIEAKYPEAYSPEARRAISAYALYVRDLLGEKDAAKAKKLIIEAGPENLSAEALAWLLSVLNDDKNSAQEAESIKQNLLNRATETAAGAHFVTEYKDGEYVLLASDRRTDAVVLEALLKTAPNHGLVPKIVRGLLAARTKGRWQNTQENAFVLVALDKYFNTFEKITPDFVARIWLGQNFAGEQKFAGRSIDSNRLDVPMPLLQQTTNAKQNLTLDRQGAGRLYYRIGLKYAPRNLNLAAADYGFALTRTYEAIDDPRDVKQNSDNSWTIKAGARVRVRIQMVAPVRRHHVALVDNLPAGFEIVNYNLAVTGVNNIFESPEMRRRAFRFEHQNLRDNRAEAFTMLLPEGVWNYSYIARATTPGQFIVPPAKAEEMYTPETFGRSKTNYVKVE